MKTIIVFLFLIALLSCEKQDTIQTYCWNCNIENTVTKTLPTGQSDTDVVNSMTFQCNLSDIAVKEYEKYRTVTLTYMSGTTKIHTVKVCTCTKQ